MALTYEQLTQKHPHWEEMAPYWEEIDLLYRGGRAIKAQAAKFLTRRPAEPDKVYAKRVEAFFYDNVLGTALGWYSTKLFAENVQFFPKRGDAQVKDEGLEKFVSNADRKGTSLQSMARTWFVRAALDGYVYVLLDLPGSKGATNWKQQIDAGELDAYATTFSAAQVTNWDVDDAGELNWAVISTSGPAPAALGEKRGTRERWYVFDREEFQVYDRIKASDGSGDAKLVANGRHAMADQRRVPLIKIELTDELQLASRVYLLLHALLNEDNGLAWKLLMSNLAIPVVAGDMHDEVKAISESNWIKLTEGSRFSWSEPAGTSFVHSAARIQSLIEEIHRQMHLQAHARSNSATPSAQSGFSKEMDLQPALDILNGYGEIFRGVFKRILETVIAIRSLRVAGDVAVDVQGMTFQSTAIHEIDDATLAKEAVTSSSTWRKWVEKRVVDLYGPNLDPAERKKIHDEIDAASDPEPAPAVDPELPVAA
jgi:hypothetical protein